MILRDFCDIYKIQENILQHKLYICTDIQYINLCLLKSYKISQETAKHLKQITGYIVYKVITAMQPPVKENDNRKRGEKFKKVK